MIKPTFYICFDILRAIKGVNSNALHVLSDIAFAVSKYYMVQKDLSATWAENFSD